MREIGIFEFGRFRLDIRERLLTKDGQAVPLTPKAFQILQTLVENHGHVVPKDDLLKRVWADTFVEEANVTWNIHSLRRALGESVKAKFIATVPKLGFRFVAPVTEVASASNASPSQKKTAAADGPSVAVLPFRNLDRDPDNEYFGDGLTEEVINTLAKIKGLRVAARTSSFAFKGKDIDIRQIGEKLGVTAVLEGSVRRFATQLRITAQLINVADGYHIWSESFDRKIDDVFKIQEEISRAIAEHMVSGLKIASSTAFATKHQTDIAAYNLFLLGRYFWNKRDGAAVYKSLDFFNACLKSDPQYAPAYAGLGDSYATLGLYRILPPNIAFAKARWAATKALEIDDGLAESYASLGIAHVWYEWNWYEGEKSFQRSIALKPDYATAHQWYALALPVMGRSDDGIAEMEQASRLEPLSLGIRATLAWNYYIARQYDRALTQARETVELDAQFLLARFYLGLIAVQKHLFAEAIKELEFVAEGTNELPITISALAHAYAVAGQRKKATQTLQLLHELSRKNYVSHYDFALAYAGLEDFDAAFESLERAHTERGWLNHLHLEPMLDGLRKDARYKALANRMGLA